MSGKKVVLLGDLGTDHEGFPPTPVVSGSPNVFIDGKPVARVGDPLAPHSKPKHPPHPRTITSGSSTVFINGVPVAITGGEISCGGVTIGSGSVVVGDTHTPVPFSGLSPVPRRPPAAGEDPHGTGAMGARGDRSVDASTASAATNTPSAFGADPKKPMLPNTDVGARRGPSAPTGSQFRSGTPTHQGGPGTSGANSSQAPETTDESSRTLRLRVFFDGTGNRRANDQILTNRDVTNVAKLHDLYRDDGLGSNYRRIYVDGPGTIDGKHTPNGFEAPEDRLGLAMGIGPEGGHTGDRWPWQGIIWAGTSIPPTTSTSLAWARSLPVVGQCFTTGRLKP